MNKTVKRILIAIIAVAAAVAVAVGALFIIRTVNRKPVSVYSVRDFAMTDYWGDTSETYGTVSTDKIQKVFATKTKTITEIFVKEGDEVHEGDILLSYDTTLTDIDLKRAEISVARLESNLEDAQKELKVISALVPHSSKLIIPDQRDIEYISQRTPQIISGRGTAKDPMYILFGNNDELNERMIQSIFEEALKYQPKPTVQEEPTTEEPTTEEPTTEEPTTEEPTTEEPTTKEPEDDEDESSEKSTEEETTEEPTTEKETEKETEPEPEPDPYDGLDVYAAFVTRDHDALNGMITRNFGVRLIRSNGSTRFRFYDPELSDDIMSYDAPAEPYYEESGSDYTSTEIAQMKAQKEQEISRIQNDLKMAQIDLERKKAEVEDDRVYSTIDGVVKAVRDPVDAYLNNEPVLEVSAGGGYYIRVAMSELELDTLKIGQSVSVNSWDTGTVCEGIVTEILDYPTTSANSWSDGNTNVSYYPFVVFVFEDANLMEGSYVSVTYENSTSSPNSLYLEQIFVRSENGKNYVYVEGEDGKLEKRQVQTGRNLWGSYTEVKGGLSVEDHVAFPYGKDVVEGAETIEATAEEFYNQIRY